MFHQLLVYNIHTMSHKKPSTSNEKLANTSKFIFLGLLAYMPLHILIATWLGSSFGQLELAKAIKEPIMIVGFLMIIAVERNNILKYFRKDGLLYLAIFLYFLITSFSAFSFDNNKNAEILGVVYDVRFLCFFMYAVILANRYKESLQNIAVKISLIIGTIVACFGLLQILILPDNALSHIGFSKETGSQPVFYIHDEILATERASASIKDPNSLGSYIVLILALGSAYITSIRKSHKKWSKYVLVATILVACLYFTYSRSAWLGLVFGLLFLLFFAINYNKTTKTFIKKNTPLLMIGMCSLILIFVGIGITQKSVYKNVVLHDQLDKVEDSNTKRLDSYTSSLILVKNNFLFGLGVGAAGPVSFKNTPHQPIISENYYLQIILEYGLIGILIFMFILVYITTKLFKLSKNKDLYALALLVSFLAISFANLFNHNWANEAVAYVWWGLAGLFMYNSKNLKQE